MLLCRKWRLTTYRSLVCSSSIVAAAWRNPCTWPEAVRRVLGQFTDPVPPDSARAIVQRLDQLETKLDRVTGQVEWIASYLRERAEQQGRARSAPQPTPVTPPEQTREG